MDPTTRRWNRTLAWLAALALLAAGCGGAPTPGDGADETGDLPAGVYGTAAWGEAAWR